MTPEGHFSLPGTTQNELYMGNLNPNIPTAIAYSDFQFPVPNGANFGADHSSFTAQMSGILPRGAVGTTMDGIAQAGSANMTTIHSTTYHPITPAPLSPEMSTAPVMNQPSSKGSKAAILAELEAAKQRISRLEGHARVYEATLNREVAAIRTQYDQKLTTLKQDVLSEIATLRTGLEEVKMTTTTAMLVVDESDGEEEENKMGEVASRKKAASTAAFSDTTLKSVVRQSFQRLMGVAKLTAAVIPWWPKDGEEWPVDMSTNERRLRFRWDESAQHTENFAGIQKIIAYIRQNGPTIEPAVAGPLADIGEKDLEQRVIKKFQDLQKTLRMAGKLAGQRQVKIEEPTGEANGLGEESKSEKKGGLTKATRQSRARGKVEMRTRKVNVLPAESSWKDKKYLMALVETMMSDDEDELDGNGKKTGRYISRAPEWRSQILQDFLDAVDNCEDPAGSNRYVTRVRGEHKEGPLPTTKKTENKARRWMVSVEWLSKLENRKYDTAAYLLDNGRAWGDPKDPEEMLAGQKRIKEEKKEIAVSKRMKLQVDGAGEQQGKKAGGKRKTTAMKMNGVNKDVNAPVVPPVPGTSKVTLDDDEFSPDEN